MLNYEYNLHLPYPLASHNSFKELLLLKRTSPRAYTYATSDALDYLNPELTKIFNKLGMQLTALILFGHGSNKSFIKLPTVHADAIYHNNSWVKVPFAINWELTDTTPNIKWWDVNGLSEVLPSLAQVVDDYDKLANGVHYGKRQPGGGNRNIEDFVCVHSRVLTRQACMIRTELPHSVDYSNAESRFSLSLRFDPNISWSTAVTLLKDFLQFN